MPTTSTPSDQPANSREVVGGQRDGAGTRSTTAGACSAPVRSALAPDLPCLRAAPSNPKPQAGSKSRPVDPDKNAGAVPATEVGDGPVTRNPQSSSTAAPSSSEEELLDEDEAMVDAPGAQRVSETLQQGSGLAILRDNAAVRHPGGEKRKKLTDAAVKAGTGKRKKSRRGSRRRRRKKVKQATEGGAGQVEPTAPRPRPTPKPSEPSLGKQGGKKSSRPVFLDSRLPAWDRLPAAQRRLFAEQERHVFRKSGVLVSRLDLGLYRSVDRYNAGSLLQIFPRPPKWWPGDWGGLPVPLPWEVCLFRAKLVSVDEAHPLWSMVFQLFLEHLAKGWDLHVLETPDRAKLASLPDDLAKKLVYRGAFAFAAGPPRLLSFQLLLDRLGWREDVPDQRVAQAEAWESVGSRSALERLALVGENPQACDCSRRLARAVTRLGLESKVLDASSACDVKGLSTEVERLASVASAALTFSLAADEVLAEIVEDLRPADSEAIEATLGRVRRSMQPYRPLFGYFSYLLRDNYERLHPNQRGW